jgi:hypothetical protein
MDHTAGGDENIELGGQSAHSEVLQVNKPPHYQVARGSPLLVLLGGRLCFLFNLE